MEENKITILYRCERDYFKLGHSLTHNFGDILADYGVDFVEYKIQKHTDKGFWIDLYWNKKRWVSNSGRKRFAYPTKELALESFIKRTTKALTYSKANVKKAEGFLKAAKKLSNES